MRVPTCVHFELAGHSSHAADRSSLEKSMERNSSVERRESVVWPQRRHRSRSEQAEGAIFSGSREERCLATVSSSKQSERSSVEQGERAISASASVTSGPKPKMIAAGRGKL